MGKPTGRPPKPTEAKRRVGNPGHRKLPPPTQILPAASPAEPPAPPRPLGSIGTDFWNRAWKAGAAWISASTDVELLQVVCEQLDERQALRALVLRDPSDWRSRAGLRALDKQIADGLSMLGFTPTDRARLGGGEVGRVDELEEFRRRVANRRAGK